MNKILGNTLVIIIIIVTVSSAFAQNKKVNKNDEMPSQQELQQMMQEMEKEMEDMDPESKEMMKQMGIKMPDTKTIMKGISGNSQEDLQKAWDNQGKTIPDKDGARIAVANSKRLTQANLPDYVKQVHNSVIAKVGTKGAAVADEIVATAKTSGKSSAQMANGLWMFGANIPAVLVLGKTISEQPANDDNLNNYAAFLVMTGAEEAALPILNILNKKYPKNSTILNNIGQAWFGLGDLEKANAYFDSTLALYPGHSQANFTKSLIQEHKGDKSGAFSSMKRSIKTGYSITKENRLNGFNYKLKGIDVDWNPPFPQDPLGFGQMNWPKYPKSVEESMTLEKEWEVYRETLRGKTAAIEQKFEKAEEEFTKTMEDPLKIMQNLMKTNLKLQLSSKPFASKAKAKLEYYNENDDKLELQKYENQLQNLDELEENMSVIDNQHEKKLNEIEATLGKKIGEGSTRADMEAYCAAINKNNDKYLQAANQLLEEANAKWIKYWRETMSRRLNYLQFAMPDEAFEMEKLRAQMMWLGLIGGQQVKFGNKCTYAGMDAQEKPKAKKLADFYDMTCKQKSVMDLVIGKVTIECNKMTTELDAGFLKYSQRENMDNGTIIRGTVEIGKDFGIGEGVKMGPVKAELKAGAGAFIEFDSEGITDMGVKGGISAEVGTNLVPEATAKETGIEDPSTTAFGAEAKWGWNSGGSVEGKGLLHGLKIN